MRRVDQHGRQVQQPGGTQLGEQAFVQLLPDALLVPLGQPAPAGGPGSAEQFRRQSVPADAGADDVQDAFECGAVVGTPPAGIAETPRMHRKQRLKPLSQLASQILESSAVHAKTTRQLILN